MLRLVSLLTTELGDDHGPMLEIGVGTGRIAAPLVHAGIPVFGIDLSVAMLGNLVAKHGPTLVPVALADARHLPFPDDTFSNALAAHVFHLIPGWEAAVDELVRVVRPGGRLLVSASGQGRGIFEELLEHMRRLLGDRANRPGLKDLGEMDTALRSRSARMRELLTFGGHWRMKPD
ncbi:MAG: hypothetical protein QOK47_948, partial [Actinomycetota bacterium]|nr:hypothetical protein [Actinomycetota bacterium]